MYITDVATIDIAIAQHKKSTIKNKIFFLILRLGLCI